ncbi:MAG TPA: AAA family ATPase [Gammaproteobacteria bacterium]|nr:AAA family ATPase [Gammaproteobacteria bacterium]
MADKSTKAATAPAKAAVSPGADTAIIRQLTIERFRGIKFLKWNPAPGLNVILGGGDVGKSTILDAIALLLNPSNAAVVSESDYHCRESNPGFTIQAVLSLPASTEISQQQKFSWPWEWNGKEAIAPLISDGEGDDIPTPDVPAYRFQVRGTSEMELVWEIVQPNDDVEVLSAAVRRAIGVVRLGSDDRNDRDLRLVYGSALDRLIADQGFKPRIGKKIAEINLGEELSDDAKKSLQRLDDALREGLLPSGLELGLTSAQGISIGALIGLLASKKLPENSEATVLPLASWGAGTRRMATLQIAAATQTKTRIAVIDEVERGLEPYRVRKLIESLHSESTQTFITTHSAVAINAATDSTLWYLDPKGNIGELSQEKIKRQQERDPETFLARLAVIAEGPTEVGFVSYFLQKAIKGSPRDHGIRVCDGQGTPAVLGLLEAMSNGGLKFAGFVDSTTEDPARWRALKEKMGDLLFQWESGSTEASVIKLVEDGKLTELIKDEEGAYDPERRKTLADRLAIDDKGLDAIVTKAGSNLRAVIIAAAGGNSEGASNEQAKTWKKHGKQWFKSVEGGRELAQKAEALGAWPQIKPALMPFLNAVRAFAGLSVSEDL